MVAIKKVLNTYFEYGKIKRCSPFELFYSDHHNYHNKDHNNYGLL